MDAARNHCSTRFGGAGIRLAVFAAVSTVGLAACGSSVPASSGTPAKATTTCTCAAQGDHCEGRQYGAICGS